MRLNYILGIGIVLALVSASLLVAFGFLYVKPYINVRTYKETVCTTVSQDHSMRQPVTCQCAADGSSTCVSQYPCIKVWVNYTRVDSVFVENATLYDSYETFHIQQSALQVLSLFLLLKFMFLLLIFMFHILIFIFSVCFNVALQVSCGCGLLPIW